VTGEKVAVDPVTREYYYLSWFGTFCG
jgi:hypothetical protein